MGIVKPKQQQTFKLISTSWHTDRLIFSQYQQYQQQLKLSANGCFTVHKNRELIEFNEDNSTANTSESESLRIIINIPMAENTLSRKWSKEDISNKQRKLFEKQN